ncbi:membrane transporter [Oryctes borbonicus]|uniref:Membrane transporter n=1 Tax=Oryctes borbonicus TaxID=1629725 RepID=A0A0T6AUS9_9SCAR|nr:membrane transporter [Oryctes borbonicus]
MALPGCRFIMAVLLSIGLAIIYGLKVNLSVAIVSMVNYTAVNLLQSEELQFANEDFCSIQAVNYTALETNQTDSVTFQDGPFNWSPNVQGIILSSYFWGYLAAMFPGSQIAEIISAKWVFFFAVLVNIIGTLATPISCYTHYTLVYVVRIAEGLGGGVTFPTTHVLLAHWAPPNERSIMASIAFSGTILGTVISNLLSGIIAIEAGWEWVFYIMGALSTIWLLLWVIFVTDKPRDLKFIGQKELDMIESSLGTSGDTKKRQRKVPWKKILESKPFWAILVAHTCSNWGFYMLLLNMPLFMKQVLKFTMAQVSIYAAIPYFIMWLFSLAIGQTLDRLRQHKKITTTTARKIATLIASAPVAICLLILSFVSCQIVAAVILLTASLTAMGAMYSGFMTNHIDIANNYAGTLMGMTNTIATIPGIVGPLFVGMLIDDDPSIKSWSIIFYVTIGFFIIEILVYTLFGKGDEQPWNKPEDDNE